MEHRLEEVTAALRVLACVTEKHYPEDPDVVEALIGLKPAQISLDAYVDGAVRKALEDSRAAQIARDCRAGRARTRAAHSSDG